MTISTTTGLQAYNGNGVTTLFAIPFYWVDDAHILVTLKNISTNAVVTWILGTNYTLSGVGTLAGGSLTAIVAPAAGFELDIRRVVPIVQTTNYIANDTLPAEIVELDLDYLTMICQQLSDSVNAIAGGASLTFQNLGGGTPIYAGTASGVVQLNSLKAGANISLALAGGAITIASTVTGIDQTADYTWTGHHTWNKQAARTIPSAVLKSLQGGVDIVDANILLAADYSTAFDVRKNTDVAVEAPVDTSWGGNFGIYLQHKASGNASAAFGTLTGGIRAQLETTQARNGALINDAVAMYAGIYNNGTDVGGFGFHVDAYHTGAATTQHQTIGISAELYKNIVGGVAAGAVIRTLGAQVADYGLIILHAGSPGAFNRGIQLGSPVYSQGGILGASGGFTTFSHGIDFTWGSYTGSQLYLKRDTYVIWSGLPLPQGNAPDTTCVTRWNSGNGNWELNNNATNRFEVNLTNGIIRQNGNDAIGLFTSQPWAFRFSSAFKTSGTVGLVGAASAPPAAPDTYLVVQIDGVNRKIPLYNP